MAWPAPFPGWLLEPAGDGRPRGMTVTPQGAQDPAYRPTPLFLLASLLAVPLRVRVGVRVCWSSTLPRPSMALFRRNPCSLPCSRFRCGCAWACGFVGHQRYLGHPWPCFDETLARFPARGSVAGARGRAGLLVINATSAIHGLVSNKSGFDWSCARGRSLENRAFARHPGSESDFRLNLAVNWHVRARVFVTSGQIASGEIFWIQ